MLATAGDGPPTFIATVLYSTNLSRSTLGTVLTIEFGPIEPTFGAGLVSVQRAVLLQAHSGTVTEIFNVPNNTNLDGSPVSRP